MDTQLGSIMEFSVIISSVSVNEGTVAISHRQVWDGPPGVVVRCVTLHWVQTVHIIAVTAQDKHLPAVTHGSEVISGTGHVRKTFPSSLSRIKSAHRHQFTESVLYWNIFVYIETFLSWCEQSCLNPLDCSIGPLLRMSFNIVGPFYFRPNPNSFLQPLPCLAPFLLPLQGPRGRAGGRWRGMKYNWDWALMIYVASSSASHITSKGLSIGRHPLMS